MYYGSGLGDEGNQEMILESWRCGWYKTSVKRQR